MEEEKRDVLFGRSAFGGFKRKNVIKYIEELQNELAQSKSEALKQKKLLEDYKRSNASAVENCMNSAKSAVEEVDRMLISMSEQLKTVRAEKDELEKQMQLIRAKKQEEETVKDDAVEDKIAALMEQIGELRARLAAETVANNIIEEASETDNDDDFCASVEEESVEETVEAENNTEEITADDIDKIIDRFLK